MVDLGSVWHKIFPASGYRSPLLSYQAVLVLMCVEMAVGLRGLFGVEYGGDAVSYVIAMEPLRHGLPDPYRTPVYPLWLMLLETLFGPERLAVANQLTAVAITIVGGWYFMRVAGKFTFGRRRATFWLTTVFCLTPQWNQWVAYTQTETIGLTGTVIMLWWLVRDLPGAPSLRSGVMSSLWLAVLVFTRPVLMCFIPVVAVYWIAQWRRPGARGARAGLAGSGLTVALILGYMAAFHHAYGMYYMSAVSQWNNFWLLGQSGSLRAAYTDNPHLKAFINEINDKAYVEVEDPLILNIFGSPDISAEMPIEDIDAMLSLGIAENRGRLAVHIWNRLRAQVVAMPLLHTSKGSPYGLMEAVVRPVIGLYLLFLAGIGICLVVLWRHGVRPPGSWLCWLLCVSLAGASVIGAQSDWARLMMPTVPAALMLVYQMVSFFRPVDYERNPA